ncbi:MAG: exodeoxyribonuclease III [Stellaceae bacterium]
MTIATWNINSVRLRVEMVKRFLAEADPDVLCLQETKTPDEHFPRDAFAAAGYEHQLVHGMKAYNGVAVISRLPFASHGTRDWCERADCRHGHVMLANGIELHDLYVPAGGDVPDPDENRKFAHKLRFLDEVTGWFEAARDRSLPMVLVGDLNIAPLENDVWSHKQLLKVVSHTPVEIGRLEKLRQAAGFIDAVRHFVPASEKLYSWWSYRNNDWAKSDRGRRLDHIWVTPALEDRLLGATIHREARGWDLASDHVPVVMRLKS